MSDGIPTVPAKGLYFRNAPPPPRNDAEPPLRNRAQDCVTGENGGVLFVTYPASRGVCVTMATSQRPFVSVAEGVFICLRHKIAFCPRPLAAAAVGERNCGERAA
jgi:hypothetical protein